MSSARLRVEGRDPPSPRRQISHHPTTSTSSHCRRRDAAAVQAATATPAPHCKKASLPHSPSFRLAGTANYSHHLIHFSVPSSSSYNLAREKGFRLGIAVPSSSPWCAFKFISLSNQQADVLTLLACLLACCCAALPPSVQHLFFRCGELFSDNFCCCLLAILCA